MKAKVLLLVISIIISIVFGEFLLRLFAQDIIPLPVPDKELGHLYRKNFETVRFNEESQKDVKTVINSQGFLGKEWRLDNDSYKIMVLGDSLVASLEVNEEERFTDILEKKFLNDDKKAEVFNLGKSGSGPENYLVYLKKFYPIIKPDVVIVGLYNGNDFANANYKVTPSSGRLNYLIKDDEIIRYSDIAPLKKKLIWDLRIFLGKFYLPQIIYKVYKNIKYSHKQGNILEEVDLEESSGCPLAYNLDDKNWVDSYKITEYLLKEMKAVALDKLLILQIPAKGQPKIKSDNNCDNQLPEKLIKEFSEQEGIKLIQLLPLMGDKIEDYYWSHFNYQGHKFVAEVIYDYLNNEW